MCPIRTPRVQRNKKGDNASQATRKQPSGRISIYIIGTKTPQVKRLFWVAFRQNRNRLSGMKDRFTGRALLT